MLQLLVDGGELRLGVLVDPGDRRARQDVVELLGQHPLPQVVDIGGPPERRRPEFGLDQQALASTVAELGLELARQRAPVHLEVQLTAPHRHRGAAVGVTFDALEHRRRSVHLQGCSRVDPREPASALEHLAGRATATVAVTEGHQRVRAPAVVLEVRDREVELLGCDLGVVGVDRREVREDSRSVQPLPPERVVREPVLFVPTQLLGDETMHSPSGEHLGKTGWISEHIGDPDLGTPRAEVLLEVALPEHDLADEALPRGQVHVGLDPHSTDRHPLTTFDACRDLREQLGVAVFDPCVVLGRRAAELVLRVVVHEGDRRGERPGALPHRLAHGPQPRSVDVGVADRDGTVTGRVAEVLGQCRCDHPLGGGDVGDAVQRLGQDALQAGPPWVVGCECPHDAVEHLDVVGECLGVGIDHDQGRPPERVQRALSGRGG